MGWTQVMGVLDGLVRHADQNMDGSAEALQAILAAAADDAGEFHLPLADDKRDAMAQALDDTLPLGTHREGRTSCQRTTRANALT